MSAQLCDGLLVMLACTMGTIVGLGLASILCSGWQCGARVLGNLLNKPAWGREKLTVRG